MADTTSNFDWSTFTPGNGRAAASGVPTGYTAVQIPGAAGGGSATPASSGVRTGTGGSSQYFQESPQSAQPQQAPSSAPAWGLQDASGKIYKPGDALSITSQTPTGQTSGGFDDAFYNKYKQSVLNYYMPQVDKQYKDAKDELTYRLARSGNLRSSAANTSVADLASQNDINAAGVRNQADTAEGDLRTQVASERAKATSQLYATEDPEVAANQALSSVRDISLQQPDLSPLSSLFNVATVGGANLLKGYQGAQSLNTFNSALNNKNRNQTVVRG